MQTPQEESNGEEIVAILHNYWADIATDAAL